MLLAVCMFVCFSDLIIFTKTELIKLSFKNFSKEKERERESQMNHSVAL